MAPIEYDKRDESKGPETYRSQPLLDTIFKATSLEQFQGTASVIDIMSGPGGIAFDMQVRAPQHSYAVLDNNKGQLDKISKPIKKILADVRVLSSIVEEESADVVTARYGVKDIPEYQQLGVLAGVNRILKPGGVFVLTDMISSEGTKEWLNMQHSKKQQLSGRNIEKEGECHIPTEQEWLEMLKIAGFEAKVFGYFTSKVSTENWLTGNQFGDPKSQEAARKKAIMDEIILGASEDVKKEFNIRQEGTDMKIDYPVVIIRAVKKEAQSGLSDSGEVYVAK